MMLVITVHYLFNDKKNEDRERDMWKKFYAVLSAKSLSRRFLLSKLWRISYYAIIHDAINLRTSLKSLKNFNYTKNEQNFI